MQVRWRRPRQTAIRGDRIVGNFSSRLTYPLSKAVDFAFDELVECRSEGDVGQFTGKWGFLFELGDRERLGPAFRLVLRRRSPGLSGTSEHPKRLRNWFSVGDFFSWRDYLLSLSYLATAFRGLTDLPMAVNHWKNLPIEKKYVGPALSILGISGDWRESLRRRHRRIESSWPTSPDGYAVHLLAFHLKVSSGLEPVQEGDAWHLGDAPDIESLQDATVWTLRQRIDSIEYRICESCNNGFIVKRKDQRFCSYNCGVRARMARLREKQRADQPEGGKMDKYYPLQRRLEQESGQRITFEFEEIEQMLGASLPRSSRTYDAWWSNEDHTQTKHVQCKSWGLAGWQVESVDLSNEKVTFSRRCGR